MHKYESVVTLSQELDELINSYNNNPTPESKANMEAVRQELHELLEGGD